MWKIGIIILLVAGFIPLPGASAQSSAAERAFITGHYIDAANAAEIDTADDLAFRAKALLAEAIVNGGVLPDDLLNEAIEAANSAIALDPAHADARLQRSIAQSLKTRAMSTRQVRASGLGEQAKKTVEALVAEDDTNAYAHMFLSVWHLEVWQRGGRAGAIIMGASRKAAKKHYQRAAALAGDDPAIHWQYARALTALNAKKYRSEIDIALDHALAAHGNDVLDRTLQARAGKLREALNNYPTESVEMLAASMH